jgi:Raf kinase inhibitor-like YbhB/YbcL family protein
MLEKIPQWLGAALSNVRAGHEKLVIARIDLSNATSLNLSSPAFAPGDRLPPRFTADGEGVSPPLVWSNVPAGTANLALIVEDPDAPTPRPLVHAVVVDIDARLNSLPEAAIAADGGGSAGKDVGKNSRFTEGWLPPDPPTGHGSHDYVFQLFALGASQGDDKSSPGRSDFVEHLQGRVLAAGALVGTYSRGEEAEIGSVEAAPASI